jgi:preprotein translocase subunit SecF
MFTLIPENTNINFTGRFWLFAVLSGLLTLGCIALVATKGLNFGIDFAGGYEVQAKIPPPATDRDIEKALDGLGGGELRVQRYGDEALSEYLIVVREHGAISPDNKAALRSDMEKLAGGAEAITTWTIAESGESMSVGFNKPVTEEQVREVLGRFNLNVRDITRGERTDEPEYKVNLTSLTNQIEERLVKTFNLPAEPSPVLRAEFVGPQVGSQLRTQGIMAIVWAMFFMLLYVGVRFDLYFAPGAIVALLHDLAITLGVFSAFQLEFSLATVAALLTVVGYSINDTIVVYDRVRENVVRRRGMALRPMINISLNETLARTVLTGATTFLVIICLWAFTDGVIRDLAIALFAGIAAGTYSSIAVATPLYVWLKERYGKAEAKQQSGGHDSAAGQGVTSTATSSS